MRATKVMAVKRLDVPLAVKQGWFGSTPGMLVQLNSVGLSGKLQASKPPDFAKSATVSFYAGDMALKLGCEFVMYRPATGEFGARFVGMTPEQELHLAAVLNGV
jgi:hypothetical protein